VGEPLAGADGYETVSAPQRTW